MNDLLTNREIAALLTVVVIFGTMAIFSARKSDGLALSIKRVLRSLTHRKLLVPLVTFLAVIGIAILIARKIGLWIPSLWKPLAIWVLLTGVGLYFRVIEALKNPTFFSDTLKQTLGFGAVVEFIANLESFPLGIEIGTQLLAGILALMTIPSRNDPPSATLVKVTNGYLVLLVASAFIWTVWSAEWEEVDHTALLLEIFLPIWLTVVAVLYLYPLALFVVHETTFVQMRRFSRVRRLCFTYRKMAAIVLRSGLSLRAARTIGNHAGIIVETDGFRPAWQEAATSIRQDQERIDAERAAQRRLVENAGLLGIDQGGKQLDQREHAETKETLRRLEIYQMGHYRNLHRYRNDKQFAGIVDYAAEQHGLPTPTDIRLRVSPDGQSWYAARETITGHWFAIGAAAPPPDQWLYDGTAKPADFPNEHEWDQWESGGHSVNWEE